MKISVYKNGTEQAWASFRKSPGLSDLWLDPGRVIDSYPWDKTKLQETTAHFATFATENSIWSLSEGESLMMKVFMADCRFTTKQAKTTILVPLFCFEVTGFLLQILLHCFCPTGRKYNSENVTNHSAHRKWLVMYVGDSCLIPPETQRPAILYSTTPEPQFLATTGESNNFCVTKGVLLNIEFNRSDSGNGKSRPGFTVSRTKSGI